MNSQGFTKRELYIKSIFLPTIKSEKKTYLPEKDVDNIVKAISNIGERYGFVGDMESQNKNKSEKRKHKYDVWIAKEIKKNDSLMDRFEEIRLVLDWAVENNINMFTYSFEEALCCQKKWHQDMLQKYDIEKIEIPELDSDRIIFRSSDEKHFLYILSEKELRYEGKEMSICVGADTYKSKVRNGRSIIISLRDNKNRPHVTTEIDVSKGEILQQYGKGNSTPIPEYKKVMLEFVLYATNYEHLKNLNILKLLN